MNQMPHVAFGQEWVHFLEDLSRVCSLKLDNHSSLAVRNGLKAILMDLLRDLASQQAVSAIVAAVQQSDPEEQTAVMYLRREMQFYHAYVAELGQHPASSEAVDGAIKGGKTIKDSAEKLITRLPRVIQNLLHVLNEILGLVVRV